MDKRLMREALCHKGFLTGAILCGLAAAAVLLVQSWEVSVIVNAIFMEHAERSTLAGAFGIAAAAVGVRFLLNSAADRFGLRLAESVQADMRRRIVDTLAHLPYTERRELQKGQVLGLLYDGIDNLSLFYSGYLPQLVRSVAVPALFLAVVFPLDRVSGFTMLFTLPLIPVFMMLIGTWTKHASARQWQTLMRFSTFLEDVLRGLETLVSLGRSRDEGKRIAEASEGYRVNTFWVQRWAFLSSMALELVATLSIALVAVGLGIRLSAGEFAFLPAFYILLLAPDYYEPMRTLGRFFHAGLNAKEAAESLYAMFDRRLTAGAKGEAALDHIDSIDFDRVSYRYPGANEDAVRNVNLHYHAGERAAFVGQSGSGKSTLMLLAMGVIAPTSGEVRINGRPLAQWRETDRLRQISAVLQSGTLFAGTVGENIAFSSALNKSSRRRAEEMAALVGLPKLFDADVYVLDRAIEAEGSNVSGGQRALILLARALYHDGSVFFLDEMTDNLDLASEKLLSEKLPQLLKDRGAWMIAHRLGTLRAADVIYVMSKGSIVAAGTYDEVVDAQGHFAGA